MNKSDHILRFHIKFIRFYLSKKCETKIGIHGININYFFIIGVKYNYN
jgi:hypothetical protein